MTIIIELVHVLSLEQVRKTFKVSKPLHRLPCHCSLKQAPQSLQHSLHHLNLSHASLRISRHDKLSGSSRRIVFVLLRTKVFTNTVHEQCLQTTFGRNSNNGHLVCLT